VRNESSDREIWPEFQEPQRRLSMKKVMVCLLALTFVMSTTAFAQDTMSQSPSDKSAAAAPLKALKGTVKVDGDKVTFVSDKDQKSWDVMNPEELKAHDGHHVQLSAHVYADKNSIHVMSVKMLKGEKGETMSK
jgi:biopolymer transport protein ExbD